MNKEEGEEQKTNTVKNDSSSIEINKEKEYKNKEKKNKLFINNLNLDIKPKENIENCSSTIKNNRFEKFLCFLKEKEKFYGELKYDPPVLKYLISKNGQIDINYLKYQKERNNFIDHLYDNMENFILKLSLNSIDFLNDKYGYYCNKENNKYIEGLYSVVDLNLLEEKIISDTNFPKDDFNAPDENIARNAFKSRALSLEYYINNNFLLQDLKVKENPRVIYFFHSIDDIMKIDEENKDNDSKSSDINNDDNNIYISINNESGEKEKKEFSIIEVDGIILENNEVSIDLNEKIFIQDKCYEFGVFDDKTNKIKSIEYFTKTNPKQKFYNFNLEPHTLAVIEIKNQFPPDEKISQNKKNNNQGKSFQSVLKGLVKNALVFKTIYEQKKYELKKIKLILFYDAIHKYNYENDLQNVMNEVLDINDIELIEKLQFQCIYIKSSYLLGTVSSMENELEKLKKENKIMKMQLGTVSSMENEMDKLKIENKIMKMELEKTQQLVEELRKKVYGDDQKNNKESNNNEKDNIK